MKLSLRFSSLFWTFSIAFLAVLILAIALQSWITVTLLTRLRVEFAEPNAVHLSAQIGQQIETLKGSLDAHEIIPILRRQRAKDPSIILMFRPNGGGLLPDRRLERSQMRQLSDFLGISMETMAMPNVPDALLPPTGPERRFGPFPRPAEAEMRPRRMPPMPTQDNVMPTNRYFLLHRQDVFRNGQRLGEIIAVYRDDREALWPLASELRLLLFIPLAVILAGGGGMILLQLLLKRIRQLERFTDKVSDGDLVTRIPAPGIDEIGRLGQRLNHMAEVLQKAKNQVEVSERQRRHLLAEVSHELGTPLTSIRGYAETLLDSKVPKSEVETALYLENVLEEAKRMAELLNDLYDLAHLEADPAALEPVILDFAALCKNTVKRFLPHFQHAGINLVCQGCNSPVNISADGRRMEQVVENLLSNALRYVPAGGTVTLSLALSDGACRLLIDDTGPGVPEQDLPLLFKRFFRAVSSKNKKGSGLGLAIVNTIVERHGGSVHAKNLRPSGLRIVIDLPTDHS